MHINKMNRTSYYFVDIYIEFHIKIIKKENYIMNTYLLLGV